jgi:hypothetical protein
MLEDDILLRAMQACSGATGLLDVPSFVPNVVIDSQRFLHNGALIYKLSASEAISKASGYHGTKWCTFGAAKKAASTWQSVQACSEQQHRLLLLFLAEHA